MSPRPPQDFIHYLPRQVVLRFPKKASDPWFHHYQRRHDGFERPTRHSTRRETGMAAVVQPGDRIWIVSQIFSPWGDLPPGIDACLVVASVQRRRGGGFHFMAAPSSRWFPLRDAQSLLAGLLTVNSAGDKRMLWADTRKPIGHSLQSMRRLDSAQALLDWERRSKPLPLDFVSYRIADGTALAFKTVRKLLRRGKKVYWDRWCLPRRLAERRERVSHGELDAHLMRMLRSAAVVWGIESPLYADPKSYAQRECALAQKRGAYKPVRPVRARTRGQVA